jgi:hypothetical protein
MDANPTNLIKTVRNLRKRLRNELNSDELAALSWIIGKLLGETDDSQ